MRHLNKLLTKLSYCLLTACLIGSTFAYAEEPPPEPRKALKVCADPTLTPYSNKKLDGFENKIAQMFADSLGLPVEYEWFPSRYRFIRKTLKDDQTPDGSYKCDIAMGLPENFDAAALSQVYYRTTWAIMYVKGRNLDDVKTQEDLANLPADKRQKIKIGVYGEGPTQEWVFKHNLMENFTPYQARIAVVDEYVGDIIKNELVGGNIDVFFETLPTALHYAKEYKKQNVEIVVIPMKSEPASAAFPGIKFSYNYAMALRFGEKEWKTQINDFIDKNRPQIEKLLAEYGIDPPLVEHAPGNSGKNDADEAEDDDDDDDATKNERE